MSEQEPRFSVGDKVVFSAAEEWGVRLSGAQVQVDSVSKNHGGPGQHRYYGHVTSGISKGTEVGFYEDEVSPVREIPQDDTTFRHPVGDALRVRILGKTGTGKTTLALALKTFLEKEGLNATVLDEDLSDPTQPHHADLQPMRMNALRERKQPIEIEIETIQIRPGL